MKKLMKFDVIDHGINHCQYFHGQGTAFTDFDCAYTGAGESAKEAFADAFDQVCSDYTDTGELDESEEAADFRSSSAADLTVSDYLEKQGEPLADGEDCELYYYVSILTV